MKTYYNQLRFILISLMILFVPTISLAEKANMFSSLQEWLIADGFDKAELNKIYNDSRTRFESYGASLFFIHTEAKLDYDQFLEKEQIQNAVEYINTHKQAFTTAEKTFNVDSQVIAAIILVETRLGEYIGKRLVFNTLSTLAALDDKTVRETFWNKIKNESRFKKKKFISKAKKKSTWAYNELKAFLKYTNKEKIDPLTIVGSYAGAMGICQFMPSNILILAEDGDQDGSIDLFNHSDAIMSVAKYLSHHGWKSGMDEKEAYKTILKYNYSSYYADTVMKIVELLKG